MVVRQRFCVRDLFLKYFLNFDLCPNEIGLMDVMGLLKPEPFFHDAFDQIGVVATSHKILEWLLVLFDVQVPVDVVREVEDEEELAGCVYFVVVIV
jgi:hypothetical protein